MVVLQWTCRRALARPMLTLACGHRGAPVPSRSRRATSAPAGAEIQIQVGFSEENIQGWAEATDHNPHHVDGSAPGECPSFSRGNRAEEQGVARANERSGQSVKSGGRQRVAIRGQVSDLRACRKQVTRTSVRFQLRSGAPRAYRHGAMAKGLLIGSGAGGADQGLRRMVAQQAVWVNFVSNIADFRGVWGARPTDRRKVMAYPPRSRHRLRPGISMAP